MSGCEANTQMGLDLGIPEIRFLIQVVSLSDHIYIESERESLLGNVTALLLVRSKIFTQYKHYLVDIVATAN